jgi:hypothetical protein
MTPFKLGEGVNLPPAQVHLYVRREGSGPWIHGEVPESLVGREVRGGGLYPLDAFARADVTFWDWVLLQGEVTMEDRRMGLGWKVF